MPPKFLAPLAALAFLAACAAAPVETTPQGLPVLSELPEGLAEIAGPGQNLARVVILPEDGCYWYEHVGPVETTLLPLRTEAGRPICSRPRT